MEKQNDSIETSSREESACPSGCFEVWIGDPAEIKTRRVKKQKTDRKDAQLLLRLMREDNFPQIWVPSPENRDRRQLLWHRHRLVQVRTRIMNQLQALAMNGNKCWKKKLWSEQGRAELEKLALAPCQPALGSSLGMSPMQLPIRLPQGNRSGVPMIITKARLAVRPAEMTDLVLESEPMQQRLETRSRTQSVQLWIDLGEDDGIGTILVGLLEPIDRLIIFRQARIDDR
jgi:hypothetical protein